VDFPRTAAASGKPTGLAINFAPDPDAKTLVMYFEVGGAAWSYLTASLQLGGYGAVMHLNGYTEREWKYSPLSALYRRMWLFDREDETNPSAARTSPTSLLHRRRLRRRHHPHPARAAPGLQKKMHFRGQHNVREYLQRLVPLPEAGAGVPDRLVGRGYGATFSWWLANVAWPNIPVDVISDSGHPIFFPHGQFDRWFRTWAHAPRDGRECRNGLRQVLEYAERHILGPQRYALITHATTS